MFADSYPMREIQDGFFYEVDGKVRLQPSEWMIERKDALKNCRQLPSLFF